MTTIRTALLAAALAGTVSAQAIPVPNASFEEGDAAPVGWQLSDGGGEWLAEGAPDGDRAIAVTGDGTGSNHWLSEPLPLEPGTAYVLRFRARSMGAAGGTPVSGPPFCNRDLGAIAETWTAYESVFVTPDDRTPGDARLRFGQWRVKGTVAFDGVELFRAMPVYDWRGPLVLGEGEIVRGTEYTFNAPFGAASRNHARPLAAHTARFNSNRWVFGSGDVVVYRHAVADREQTSAEVTAAVTWHAAGELAVEASTNGKNWTPLGTLAGVSGGTFAVPADLLRAKAVWVRLRARPAGGKDEGRAAALQVGDYAYWAALTGEPVTHLGRTDFFAVTDTDPRLKVQVSSVGDAVPGGDNTAVLRVTNTTRETLAVLPAATVDGAAPVGAEWTGLAPGEHTCRLRYVLPGPGPHTVRLGLRVPQGPGFRAEVPLEVAPLHAASYGESLPASNEAVGLWWCRAGWKVSRRRGPPTRPGAAIRIVAARNETDAAQLVLRPREPLKGLTVDATPLAGPDGTQIPASAVEVLRVRYVLVTRPTDTAGCIGWWPDPLPPIAWPLELEAGRNQPLWVRVAVPKGAKAGTYRGGIRLKADGYTAEVPLEVRVFDFSLPDRMTCRTAFGFRADNVWRYHNLTDEADRRAVLAKYLADFAAHHISPYDPAPMDRIEVAWPEGARKGDGAPLPPEKMAPQLDFSAWDRAMARAFDEYHFNSFRLRIPGMGGGTFHRRYEPSFLGWAEDTPQFRAAFTNYCRLLEAHLREKGWLDYAYVYWFDEPAPRDYAFVMNGFRKLKDAAPGLTRMLTEQVEPGLVGGPDLWCPVSPNYDHAKAEARRAHGESFWWYVCTGPKTPYAGLFIDHPATELRVWLWQTWKRRIDGVLVWSTNYWTSGAAYPDPDRPQDPYEDPMGWVSGGYSTEKGVRRPWGNGDGRFIYPPERCADGRPPGPVLEGPVDSIRWEMLRDGIEDYEYLAILRRLLAEKGGRLEAEERTRCEALLEVPEAISKSMTDFTSDPVPIEARRREIAEAIEALKRR